MLKKISIYLLAIVVVLGSFVGCGKEEKTSSDETSSETSTETSTEATTETTTEAEVTDEEITLTVWESTGGPDAFIQQAGEAFTAKYPNIKVEYVNVELGNSTSQIALDGPAGVGPDVFAAPHDKLGELVTGGHVLPTVNAEDLTGRVLGATSTALTYDGTMYGYPVSAETYALFYNKALISEDQVPTTWEGVKEFAQGFNDGTKYGFMMDVANGYYTIIFTTSANNRLFGADGTDAANSNINSAASVEGMKFFQSLREILDVPAADLGTSITDEAFKSGVVAMYITGLWNVVSFEEAGIDFGVTALPSLPGESTPAASFSGTRAMFVSAYSEHPEEAALFADFLTTEEMQALRFELTGSLPSISIEVDSPYVDGFLQQLDYAFPMPSIPAMSYYWDGMNAASANIWDGADIQTELDTVNAVMMQ